MSPLVIVDTDLPEPRVKAQTGKYYKDECRNAIEKAVCKWVSEKPITIETQTDHVMSTTTDESTQYNLEDIPIENSVTSEPSRDNVDDLGKTIMTALLQFYIKFGSAKLNNSNGKGIAEAMMELSTSLFDGESC